MSAHDFAIRLQMSVDGVAHPTGRFDLLTVSGNAQRVTISLIGVDESGAEGKVTISIPLDKWRHIVESAEETSLVNSYRGKIQ
jgi:hypothetical protein